MAFSIVERNKAKNIDDLEYLLDVISSCIGSLTNPNRISNTFKTEKNVERSKTTIDKYIEYFEDAFLIAETKRFEIKGRKHINTPEKYYFTDIGLRNARLNFRQQEENHIMENIIYNELSIVVLVLISATLKYGKNKMTEPISAKRSI